MSKIIAIANKRKQIQEHRLKIDEAQKMLSVNPLYTQLQLLKAELVAMSDFLSQMEGQYRNECVEVYNTTGEKVQPGGQIKIYTVLDFDQEQARTWAIEHNHATLLKLNTSEFKKVAKTLKPDFVTITEEPKMTLARDLSEFLEEGEK